MYDPNELITIKWNSSIKKYYTDRGYKYTKAGDCFQVYAKDIQQNSTTGIMTGICDYCGSSFKVPVLEYFRRTKGGIRKFSCNGKECQRLRNSEYRYQSSLKKNYKQYIQNCKKKGYTPKTTFREIRNSNSKVVFVCPIHGENFTILWNASHKGCSCKKCSCYKASRNFILSKKDIARIIKEKNDDIILNPEDYINCKVKNLSIKCGTCGNIFISSLNGIRNGGGRCSECAKKANFVNVRLKIDEVEQRINSVNGNCLLNKNEYKSNSTKLKIRCSCGNIYYTSLANFEHGHQNRCIVCSKRESSGELLIRNILSLYNIRFEREYKFLDCQDKKPLRFDFYLPDYNKCIEFDGLQHYIAVSNFGGQKYLEDQQRKDQIKNQYCAEKHIGLLRIPYFESQNAKRMIFEFLQLDKPDKSFD